MSNNDLNVINPENSFYICDKRDISRYLVNQIQNFYETQGFQSNLFWYHQISLLELFLKFQTISKSSSRLSFTFDEQHNNPILNINEQPPLDKLSDFRLTSLNSSLLNIFKWLSNQV